MSAFHAEGFVKDITTVGDSVSFKLEPAAPYIFEKKRDDGSVVRMLLFVDDATNATKLIDEGRSFVGPQEVGFQSLIIAKANRLKVRLTIDKVKKGSLTIGVTSICVL